MVAVPLRGSTLLNLRVVSMDNIANCCRPLTGFYSSKLRKEQVMKNCEQVAVPLRGSTLPNKRNIIYD